MPFYGHVQKYSGDLRVQLLDGRGAITLFFFDLCRLWNVPLACTSSFFIFDFLWSKAMTYLFLRAVSGLGIYTAIEWRIMALMKRYPITFWFNRTCVYFFSCPLWQNPEQTSISQGCSFRNSSLLPFPFSYSSHYLRLETYTWHKTKEFTSNRRRGVNRTVEGIVTKSNHEK